MGVGLPGKLMCRKCPNSINIFLMIKLGTFQPDWITRIRVMYESAVSRDELTVKKNGKRILNCSRVRVFECSIVRLSGSSL
jgi:hypothetical protein